MRKRIISLCVLASMCFSFLLCSDEAFAAAVKLNKTKVNLKIGKTVLLKVTGTKKKVKWSSSNNNVASVSAKGKVKAKASGKCTITAKVLKKKLKCVVTVKEAKQNTDDDYLRLQEQIFDDIAKLAYSKGQVNDKDTDLGVQYGLMSKLNTSSFRDSDTGEIVNAYSYVRISYCPKYDFIDLVCENDYSSPDFDTDKDMMHSITVRIYGNLPYNCMAAQFYFDTNPTGDRVNDVFTIDSLQRSSVQELNVLCWSINSQYDGEITSSANRLANSGMNIWYRDVNEFLYESTGYSLIDMGFGK